MGNKKSNRISSAIRQITRAILLAGIVILLMGAYYSILKAGIPYQDPPIELQIQYAVDAGIGELLTRIGVLFSLCGGITCLLSILLTKKERRGKTHEQH